MNGEAPRSRLHPRDALRSASVGLRTRRLRTGLSALGIAIGIAAMVAVLGLSESSKSDLLDQLDRLGTNLLSVRAGSGIGLGSGELPATAGTMIGRIGPVDDVAAVADVDASVYRNDIIPEGQTGGVTVKAVEPDLLTTLQGRTAEGRFLNEATAEYPVAVLGSVAAERLGIDDLDGEPRVFIGGVWFSVAGVLDSFEVAPDLDRAALVGFPVAEEVLGSDGVAGTVYLRADPSDLEDVAAILPATVNPENPDEVEVSRPTDALEARAAADSTLTSLFLGLGAVALFVGGVGIANVMVISVLERRSEIGLRRALGATRRHVGVQFLAEAVLLAAMGGAAGVLLGVGATSAYSWLRGWSILVPASAVLGGFVVAVVVGAAAGLYPSARAARLQPTDALRST